MSKETKMILVIENQWAEFREIAKCLSNKSGKHNPRKFNYNVLMSSADNDIFKEEEMNMQKKFTAFADKIRIWVNPEYNQTNDGRYRTDAFEEIKNMANKADLIIMDHILGGAFGCQTGIDIAKELAKDKQYSDLRPVLFLSKTELTDKEKKEKYDDYKKYIKNIIDEKTEEQEKENMVESHTQWIFKGFFGDEILKQDYIQNEVILKGVEKLLENKKTNTTSTGNEADIKKGAEYL